jgi:hypothetical protein
MKITARLLAIAVGVAALVQANAASASLYDTRKPSIVITAPAEGAVAEDVLTVSGTASDNRKVTKVQVKVQGGDYERAVGTTNWTADIDTSLYPAGWRNVRVRALDRNGNRRARSVLVHFGEYIAGVDPPPPGDSDFMVTPEGTRIEIDSAGHWTAQQIYSMLQENGLDSTIGPRLTVKVQDQYASQASASVAGSGGTYTSFSATIYLKGVNSSFSSSPDSTLSHEYGHVWAYYHLYLTHQGDWSGYLDARGLNGNPKLDSSYAWDRDEIIAEDYRLLFGSQKAISQRPSHLNGEIAHPTQVAGLREFLANSWAS